MLHLVVVSWKRHLCHEQSDDPGIRLTLAGKGPAFTGLINVMINTLMSRHFRSVDFDHCQSCVGTDTWLKSRKSIIFIFKKETLKILLFLDTNHLNNDRNLTNQSIRNQSRSI